MKNRINFKVDQLLSFQYINKYHLNIQNIRIFGNRFLIFKFIKYYSFKEFNILEKEKKNIFKLIN